MCDYLPLYFSFTQDHSIHLPDHTTWDWVDEFQNGSILDSVPIIQNWIKKFLNY